MHGSASVLGRLERVPLRAVWTREDNRFTPWLAEAENLDLLGATLGLDLELEGTEQSIGSFRADIVCREVREDRLVLIENQLERSDHTHPWPTHHLHCWPRYGDDRLGGGRIYR